MTTPLLEVQGLDVVFDIEAGAIHAVRDVSFTLPHGRTLCIVGESGCGKSMTALALLGLVPAPGRGTARRLQFDGHDLTALDENGLRALRGHHMAMVFQDPMTSLNPVFRVGDQVAEALRLHLRLKGRAAREATIELFRQVGIPSPETRYDDYPHQLSGGMRQRVMIAMALSCGPRLLIADEPTTALDVTIQGQILGLLSDIAATGRASVLLITHDLGVVAETADDVIVMYAGAIVEHAPVQELFASPLHPYTRGLMRSAPPVHGERSPRLEAIRGNVPPLDDLPSGCAFRDRCEHAFERCATAAPPLFTLGKQMVRCWLHA